MKAILCKSVTFSHLNRSSSHLRIYMCHLHFFTSAHIISSSSHLTSAHRQIVFLSSANLHISTSSLSPSITLSFSYVSIDFNLGDMLSFQESHIYTCLCSCSLSGHPCLVSCCQLSANVRFKTSRSRFDASGKEATCKEE